MGCDYKKVVKKTIVEVKLSRKTNTILARASVDLQEPPIVIKGFTVREKGGQKFVVPPSFPSRTGAMSPIIWMPLELWNILIAKILKTYEEIEKSAKNIEKNDQK
jgi:hypothetical protein